MAHTVEFERCVDFLARMIEKYGSELLQELNGLPKEDKAEDNCQQEQQQNTLEMIRESIDVGSLFSCVIFVHFTYIDEYVQLR